MPEFRNPKYVRVDPRGGSPLPALLGLVIVASVVISAATAAWRWLTEPHPALDVVFYAVMGVTILGVIALVVIIARPNGHRVLIHYDPDAARQVAADNRSAIASATATATATAHATSPAVAAPLIIAPQYHEHRHLHLHEAEQQAVRAQISAREALRAEALEWALQQIAERAARPELPAARVPRASLADPDHANAETRRSPR